MDKKQMNTKKNGSFSIYHDLTINAPITKVFKAITEPDQLIHWWPLKCTGKPEIGRKYNFYFAPEYDWFGRVIEYEYNAAFHIKMTKSDADWNPTTFGFDLEEINNYVQIKFWHKDWPACNSHYRKSSFCWALLLNGLKNYVERGVVLPFEERA